MRMAGARRPAGMMVRLRDDEREAADRLTVVLKDLGWPQASRTLVLREGLGYLVDALWGKSPEEILNFFVEGRRRALRRRHSPPQRPASQP